MKLLNLLLASALALVPCIGRAQQAFVLPTANVVETTPDAAGSLTTATVVSTGRQNTTASSPWAAKLNRWIDVQDLSFSFRYRSEMEDDDVRVYDNGQQKSLVVADVKLDPGAKYSVHLRVSSGRTFNWAYADEVGDDFHKRAASEAALAAFSPAQLGTILAAFAADPAGEAQAISFFSRGWEMSFRELYFRAAPVKQAAVEFGSLGIEKGAGTEATTYDDDGYVTGERIRLFNPKHLFFDQVAATFAYEGDLLVPSLFARGERLGQQNYRQLLVAKKFGSHLETSADYTFDKGTHTLRQAALVRLPHTQVIDSARLELYQRLNDHILSGANYTAHQGFAVTGSKTFFDKFQLEAGAAHIDYDYGVLTGVRLLATSGFSMNGDSYLTGTRAFTRATYKAANGVTFFGYFTHTLTDAPAADILVNKQGVSGGMTVDLKALFTNARVL